MDASVSHNTWEKWFSYFPIDANGMPTSDAAYRLILYLFQNRHRKHTIDSVTAKLFLHRELVRCMCRQLEFTDLVAQDPPGSGQYRYVIDSTNAGLQAKVEVSLIEYPLMIGWLNLPYLPPG